jgi:Molybdopterin cofactor-binding domain
VYVKAEIYHDGGAYASRTPAMVGNAGTIGIGPYDVPNIAIDTWGIYTNNPPCGVVRGFGSVQDAYVCGTAPGKVQCVHRRWLSEPPPGGRARVGKVGAVRTGANRPAEMLAELRMVLADAGYRVADRAGHTGSSPLGRGRGPSATTTQAKRAGELSNEEAAFGFGLRGPLGVPDGACLLDVVVDLGEASAVGVLGPRVEDLAGKKGGWGQPSLTSCRARPARAGRLRGCWPR